MKSYTTQQLKDFYLLTLMQDTFHHHLKAIKDLAEKRGRPLNPICHISYAWPVLEAETDLQARLLILEEDMEVAGVNPNMDLQDVCSPEYKKGHPKTAPDYDDLTAFRGAGIAPGNTVFMIGTESYQNQTSDPHTYIYLEEQQMRPLFLAKKITVIPVMFSGDFPKSFAKGANYTAEIGFKFDVQEDYLRDLPNALARLHGIDRDDEFSGMRRAFETTLKMQQEGITPEVIQSRHQDLTRQLSQREDKYRNRIKVRLARLSAEQREQLDGYLAQLETQVRGKLMQQTQNLAINQPNSSLSQFLAQAPDTDALISDKATNGEGQPLWQSEKAEKLITHWDAFVSGQSSQTAWVLSGMPSGKRDWLKIQERTLWQRWQQAQALAIQEPSLANRRAAKATPLPVYIDLANPEQIANPYEQLIEQGLASLHLTQEEIDWMRHGQQLFLMIDGFDLIQAETNLAARNAFYQWQVKVLYTCQSDYLEQTPHRALYFTPTDANQQPLSEQLAFIEVSHPERRDSIDRDLDHREAVKTVSHETASKAAGLHQSLGKGLAPDQQASTHSAAQDAYWQTQARLMLQREAHTHPLHSLLQQFHDLASQQGTAINQAFISYAWPVGEACVRLQERLRRLVADSAKMGIRVMLDVEQLAPGINVEDFMARELANSQAVFLIGTPRLKSRIAESWEQNGVTKRTNAYFEFERILTKHKDRTPNTPSPICPLLLEGNSVDTSFPEEIRQASLTLIPFTEEATYFESFARFAMGLLQLDSHSEAQQLLTDYLEAYQHQENAFTPDVLQNTIIRAKEDVAKRAEAQKKAFEELSVKLGQEMMQSLMSAQNDALAQAVQGYSTQAEVCKPDSFIRQALNSYVPLNYSLNPQYTEPQDLRQRVLSQIEAGFDQKAPRFLILEGNSGGGKSLFLSYLEHHYLTTYNPGAPIPLFVRLAQLTDPNHNLVHKALSAQGYSDALIQTIQQRQVPLVLLLDGFDELPLDQLDRQQTLYTRNALHEWNATVILSCRSQQLPVIERHLQTTIDQYWRRGEHAPRTDHVFITPFDATQIEQYLTHYVIQHPGSWSVSTYQQHLENIPGLPNLVQNPFVLRLVCEALPTLTKSDTTNLSRYDIYQAFTQQWFAKEQWRLITQESLPPKQAFVQDVSAWCEDQAWELFQTKRVVMTLTAQTPQAQRRAAPIRFLEEGKAQFIHKSMQDYFAAKRCIDTLDAGLGQSLALANNASWVGENSFLSFLSDEIIPEREQQLWAMIESSREQSNYAQAASNAATALNAAGIAFTRKDLHDVAIPGADLTNTILDHANLEGADLSGVNFSLAWLAFANFKQANLTGAIWGERADWLGHRGAVNAVVLSPDKTTLASGGADGDIRLWDVTTGQCKQVLPGQKRRMPITCLDFTPDGAMLVSGSEDHGVRLWRLDTGRLVREYDKGYGEKDIEKKKYFNLEIVSITREDELIPLLKSLPKKTYALVEKQTVYRCYYVDAESHPVRVVESLVDYELSQLWRCPKDSLTTVHQDKFNALLETIFEEIHAPHYGLSHQDVVTAVQVSHDGKYIYSASRDGVAYCWILGAMILHATFMAENTAFATALAQVPLKTDLSWLFIGTTAGEINLFNSTTTQINCLHGTEGMVRSLCYHPNSHTLLSGADTGAIYAWSVRQNMCYYYPYLKAQTHSAERGQAYRGHTAAVTGLRCSQDAEWVFSSSLDHSIRLWQRESGRCIDIVEHARAPIRGFALNERSEGGLVYTADADGRIRQNLLQGNQRTQTFRHQGSVIQLLAPTQSTYWLSLGVDSELMWHSADGQSIVSHLSLPTNTQLVAADVSVSILIAAGASGVIDCYQRDAENQTFHKTELTRLPSPPSALTCSPDGVELFIAVGSQLHRYTINPFVQEQTFSGHHDIIRLVVAKDDYLYTVGDDGLLCAWSIKQTVPLWSKVVHRGAVTHLAISKDYVTTAGVDNHVRLWQRSSGECLHHWTIPVNAALAEQGRVTALAFNHDGSQLAVLLKSRYLLLFATTSGERLSAFMINASVPQSLAVREDKVLLGDEQGHLQWWQWRTPVWHLLRRTQPQLLAQYSQLEQAKGLANADHQLLGQRFASGQAQAASCLLNLLLNNDLIGLEQYLKDYPESFHKPVLDSQSFLIDYVLSQGPTDVLPLLFQLAPEPLLGELAKRNELFEELVQGDLKLLEAAQAIVSLLALQTRGFCPRLPEKFGPYPTSAMRQRCTEVLQLALKMAVQTEQLANIDILLSWSADVKTSIAGHLPLYYAVATGNREVIERLLKSGATLMDTDENNESALFWAIRLHQYSLVQNWLMAEQLEQRNYQGLTSVHLMAEHGWLVGLKALPHDQLMPTSPSGLTPLHFAAQQGHLAVFDYYQTQGIALDRQDAQGHTPLMVAIQHNRLHLVKRLLSEQLETLIDAEGRTLLHLALLAKASESVNYLLSLETIAAYRYHPDKMGNTPLLLAIENNGVLEPFLDQSTLNVANQAGETPLLLAIRHQRLIDALLQAGAEVNVKANNGDTPLSLAVRQKNLTVTEQLLAHGASLDSADQEGNTPLHLAAVQGHADLLSCLLALATPEQLNRKNQAGESPWLLFSPSGNATLMAQFLDKGAAINRANQEGRTALYHAAALGDLDVVQLLLEKVAAVGLAWLKANNNGTTPLWIACLNGHEAVVRLLLEHGASIDQADKSGITPLAAACENGHEAVVRLLLERGAAVDQATENGITPLRAACQDGHEAVASLLLDHGATVDQVDKYGDTPLWAACMRGHEAVVQLLIKKGAHANQANNRGVVPFYTACLHGHETVARLLLDHGAAVDQAANGHTPLWAACMKGHEAVVRLLLENGASADKIYEDEYTPFFVACSRGDEAIARLLLKHGATIMNRAHNECTMLYMVCKDGHVALARLLLEYGANANQTNENGVTSLCVACKNGHEAVARLLLERGVNVNQASTNGETPLISACRGGHEAVVRLLLEKGAAVDQVDNEGNNPLLDACGNGHEAVARLLLNHGATVGQANNDGVTSFWIACANGHEAIMRLLLDCGAYVDSIESTGTTSLWIACASGHETVVRLLLEKGATVDQADNNGSTPLLVACEQGHETVARLLLDHGANIDLPNDPSNTPLLSACEYGCQVIVQLLLDKGANLAHQNKQGKTALHFAVEHGQSEIVKLLLSRASRSIINLKNTAGETAEKLARDSKNQDIIALFEQATQTLISAASNGDTNALWIACKNGDETIVRLLLDQGMPVNQADNGGITPLWIACQNGHEVVARLLLDHGAAVHVPRNDGSTPLYIACYNGHEAVARLLLEREAQIDQVSSFNTTPLWIACYRGHEAVVRLLLERRASVNQANIRGITPLSITCQNGYEAVARLLLDQGANLAYQSKQGNTAFHVAVENGQFEVVKLLLARASQPIIELRNVAGETVETLAKNSKNQDIIALFQQAAQVRSRKQVTASIGASAVELSGSSVGSPAQLVASHGLFGRAAKKAKEKTLKLKEYTKEKLTSPGKV